MTRQELIERLADMLNSQNPVMTESAIQLLLDDVRADGVLDVQAPPEIARDMKLPIERARIPEGQHTPLNPISAKSLKELED